MSSTESMDEGNRGKFIETAAALSGEPDAGKLVQGCKALLKEMQQCSADTPAYQAVWGLVGDRLVAVWRHGEVIVSSEAFDPINGFAAIPGMGPSVWDATNSSIQSKLSDTSGWVNCINISMLLAEILKDSEPAFAKKVHDSIYNSLCAIGQQIVRMETMQQTMLIGIMALPLAEILPNSPLCSAFTAITELAVRSGRVEQLVEGGLIASVVGYIRMARAHKEHVTFLQCLRAIFASRHCDCRARLWQQLGGPVALLPWLGAGADEVQLLAVGLLEYVSGCDRMGVLWEKARPSLVGMLQHSDAAQGRQALRIMNNMVINQSWASADIPRQISMAALCGVKDVDDRDTVFTLGSICTWLEDDETAWDMLKAKFEPLLDRPSVATAAAAVLTSKDAGHGDEVWTRSLTLVIGSLGDTAQDVQLTRALMNGVYDSSKQQSVEALLKLGHIAAAQIGVGAGHAQELVDCFAVALHRKYTSSAVADITAAALQYPHGITLALRVYNGSEQVLVALLEIVDACVATSDANVRRSGMFDMLISALKRCNGQGMPPIVGASRALAIAQAVIGRMEGHIGDNGSTNRSIPAWAVVLARALYVFACWQSGEIVANPDSVLIRALAWLERQVLQLPATQQLTQRRMQQLARMVHDNETLSVAAADLAEMAGVICAAFPVSACCNNHKCTTLATSSEHDIISCKGSRCSQCKIARYCGEPCQVQHWQGLHGRICKRL